MYAKQMREEAVTAQCLSDDYLCDETLLENVLNKIEIPRMWVRFMQKLFSVNN